MQYIQRNIVENRWIFRIFKNEIELWSNNSHFINRMHVEMFNVAKAHLEQQKDNIVVSFMRNFNSNIFFARILLNRWILDRRIFIT